jgi:hypothetical protein
MKMDKTPVTEATMAKIQLAIIYCGQEGLAFSDDELASATVLTKPMGKLTEMEGVDLHTRLMDLLRRHLSRLDASILFGPRYGSITIGSRANEMPVHLL